jgi:hypothetical protein
MLRPAKEWHLPALAAERVSWTKVLDQRIHQRRCRSACGRSAPARRSPYHLAGHPRPDGPHGSAQASQPRSYPAGPVSPTKPFPSSPPLHQPSRRSGSPRRSGSRLWCRRPASRCDLLPACYRADPPTEKECTDTAELAGTGHVPRADRRNWASSASPGLTRPVARLLDEIGSVRCSELPGNLACRRGFNHCLSRGQSTGCTWRVIEMAELVREQLLTVLGWSPWGIANYPRASDDGLPAFVVTGLGAG